MRDFAVSPDGDTIFAAAQVPDFVTVLSTRDWSVMGGLYIGAFPNSVTLARNGSVAFATRDSWDVAAFNTTTFQEIKRYPLAHAGLRVRALDDGSRIYALTGDLYGTRYLEVIDTLPPSWPDNSRLTALNVDPSTVRLSWTPAVDDGQVASYLVFEDAILIATVPGNIHATTPVD